MNPELFDVHANPDRESWLRFRNGGIGGSDAAAVMGDSPWTTPYDLYLEKRGEGRREDISGNPKVLFGTELEPFIRERFARIHPELGVVGAPEFFGVDGIVTLVSRDRPWAYADVDAVASATGEVVEIKTGHMPSALDWGPDNSGRSGVPRHYLHQVDHYLSVTGAEGAWVAVLIDGYDWRTYHVSRDEGAIVDLEVAEDDFHRMVENGTEPEKCDRDGSALAAMHPKGEGMVQPTGDAAERAMRAVELYLAKKAEEEAADRERKGAAAQIKDIIGDAKGIVLPIGSVTWVRTQGKDVDHRGMAEADPDVVAAYAELEARFTRRKPRDGGIRVKLS